MTNSSRRRFLQSAAAISSALSLSRPAGAGTTGASETLPKIKFRDHEITKLLVGSNPLYGYSHFNSVLDKMMREWMTQDRRIEVLKQAEHAGINTWQVHYNDSSVDDWKRYRAEGGTMKVL